MIFTEITAFENFEFNIAPSDIKEEVYQNVMLLLLLIKGSQPLERDMGIDTVFIDKPIGRAETLIAAEIYDVIEKYEPRVTIESVECVYDAVIGKIIPKVKISLKDTGR